MLIVVGKAPKHSWRIRAAAWLGSHIAVAIVRLILLTCRKYHFGCEEFEQAMEEEKGKMLSVSWHRSLIYTLYFFRNRNAGIISSRSRDGELVTAVLRRFGFVIARGSSGVDKGGKDSVEEFIQYINQNNLAGIATDAPKGPPYVSKFGIITSASRTGALLAPHMWMAQRNKRVNSWDRTIIPKPFSKLVFIFDREFIRVPSSLTKQERVRYRQQLDDRLLRLMYQVDHWFEMREEYPDPRDIPVPEPVPIPKHPPRKKKKKG